MITDHALQVRMNQLHYGVSAVLAGLHCKVYWVTYNAQMIYNVHKHSTSDDATKDLIATWKRLQDLKDLRTSENALEDGRNKVDITVSVPDPV
jgi:hypothetical protein